MALKIPLLLQKHCAKYWLHNTFCINKWAVPTIRWRGLFMSTHPLNYPPDWPRLPVWPAS